MSRFFCFFVFFVDIWSVISKIEATCRFHMFKKEITEDLRNSIARGMFGPGQRLVEATLCKKVKVEGASHGTEKVERGF